MGSIIWDREMAEVYDTTYRAMSGPSVLGLVVDLLAGLARSGPALEFAVGTGRVAAADAAVSGLPSASRVISTRRASSTVTRATLVARCVITSLTVPDASS